MRNDILNELGLSPLWKRRKAALSAAPIAHSATSPANAIIQNTAAAVSPNSADEDNISASPQKTAVAATASPDMAISPPAAAPIVNINDSVIMRIEWQPLRSVVSECRRCELAEHRTQAVFGVGDRDADVVFVGEGPGYEEDKQGEPFVGPAGQLLNAMLKSIDLGRDRGVYITNIVKCRPPKNRNPQPQESKACMTYLKRQIQLIKPKLIVALGRVAAVNLLQTDEAVGSLRQGMHDYEGIRTVVTYHPAYLLRKPADKKKAWDDLRHIRRFIEEN